MFQTLAEGNKREISGMNATTVKTARRVIKTTAMGRFVSSPEP